MMAFFLFAFPTTLSFFLLIPNCPLPPVSFALLSPSSPFPPLLTMTRFRAFALSAVMSLALLAQGGLVRLKFVKGGRGEGNLCGADARKNGGKKQASSSFLCSF